MFQPSLSFLSQSIPEAMKTLGSFRSTENLPETLMHGVVDTVEALMDCFPDIQREYHRLVDFNAVARNKDFNCVEAALRLLTPAVEAVTYPLQTEHGTLSADTPLTVALAPGSAMILLAETDTEAIDAEHEWEVLYNLMWRLLEGHPSLKASIERRMDSVDESDFDYFSEAYAGMAEANRAGRVEPELAMAA